MGRIFRKSRNGKAGGPYLMRYRCADGRVIERSTDCKDKESAQAVLRAALKREDQIKSGLISAEEIQATDWQTVPIAEHMESFLNALTARGDSRQYVINTRECLERLIEDLGLKRPSDISRRGFERWLVKAQEADMSAARRNIYRTAIMGFSRWLARENRLASNPLEGVPRANEKADRRHVRRILSDDEIQRLLDATAARPLHDKRINRGGATKLSDGTTAKLRRLGESRRLFYWLMLETGLRVNEVRTLCIGDVHLGADPFIEVRAQNEKARRGAQLPIREDLASEMVRYLADRLQVAQSEAQAAGRPIPVRLHTDDRLLPEIPASVKVLNRDLAFARIEKKDAAGKVIDQHSFRHTFCTRLSRAGVSLQLGQRLMRHSTPTLTANYYTHLDLGDKREGLEKLPSMYSKSEALAQAAQAGENGLEKCPLQRPLLGGKMGHFPAQSGRIIDKYPTTEAIRQGNEKPPINAAFSTHVHQGQENEMVGDTRIELVTSTMSTCKPPASNANKDKDLQEHVKAVSPLASPFFPETSPGVPSIEGHKEATIGPQPGHNEATALNLETIAATLRGLSPADRAALARLLERNEEERNHEPTREDD